MKPPLSEEEGIEALNLRKMLAAIPLIQHMKDTNVYRIK